MSKTSYFDLDPTLDLVLEREIDVSKELVWKAWTEPEHVKKWFAPAPWTIAECEIDLQPGGLFYTVMRSPKGKRFPVRAATWKSFPTRSWSLPMRLPQAIDRANSLSSRPS